MFVIDTKKTVVKIAAGEHTIRLHLTTPTTRDLVRLMGNKARLRKGGRVDDSERMEERIKFIDDHLSGIEALDLDEKPDEIGYRDPQTDEIKKLTEVVDGKQVSLTPQVEGWIGLVNPSWKVAACLQLELVSAELEQGAVKNS